MALRPNFDPYGGRTPLVDSLVGDAYPIVKTVACHLPYIKFLADNFTNLRPQDVEFRTNEENNYVQWRYVGDTEWVDLIKYADIVGPSVELREDGEFLQWRPKDTGDWMNLVSLKDISGRDVVMRQTGNVLEWQRQGDDTWTVLWDLSELLTAAARVEEVAGQIDGIYQQAKDDLIASYYRVPILFASGLNIDYPNITVSHDGNIYSPDPEHVPFVTTGTFESSQWRIMQGVTTADLFGLTAADLIGYAPPIEGAVRTSVAKQLHGIGIFPENFDPNAGTGGDDTAAVQKCFDIIGAHVLFQQGKTYRVSNIKVAAGVAARGFAGYGYTNDEAHKRPRLLAIAGAHCIFDVGGTRGSSFEGLALDGGNTGAHGFTSGSSRLSLERVTIINCDTALGGNSNPTGGAYTRVAHVTDCMFASNNTGGRNFIDSFFDNGEMANNGTNLTCAAGSNSNVMNNYRLEWPTSNQNIRFGGTSDSKISSWQFNNCLFDRGKQGSVNLKHCTGIIFSNCINRRGNSSGDTAAEFDNVLYMENCSDINVIGCLASQGVNDDGSGPLSPNYAYAFGNNCTGINIVGGSVLNGLGIRGADTVTELKITGVGHISDRIASADGIQILGGQVFRSQASRTIPTASALISELPTRRTIGTFTVTTLTLEVSARNATSGSVFCGHYIVQLYRGGGDASVSLAPLGESGSAGAISCVGTGTQLDVSAAISADGSLLTVTFTNKSGNTINTFSTLK